MKALLLIDLQNDFFPGGALAVTEADQILPVIQKLLRKDWDLIVASKDWHPASHKSFAIHHGKEPGEKITLLDLEQTLWPVHCVEETFGAEFYPGWDTSEVDHIVYKGTDESIDSYSAFYDNGHLQSTGLGEYLKEHGVTEVYIAGLATDYCVKYSALDAIELGFKTYLVEEGCRGVNLNPSDSDEAIDEMKRAGVQAMRL